MEADEEFEAVFSHFIDVVLVFVICKAVSLQVHQGTVFSFS